MDEIDYRARYEALVAALIALDEIIDNGIAGDGHARRRACFAAIEWTRGVNAPDWLRELVLAAAEERDR
jgi:hypothetical protein